MSKTVMSLRLYARPCRIVKVDLQVGGLNDKNMCFNLYVLYYETLSASYVNISHKLKSLSDVAEHHRHALMKKRDQATA